MHTDSLFTLKTDRAFLDRLRQAGRTPTTPHERLEQRISFVLGAVKSNVTRDEVREAILNQQGMTVGVAPEL